MAAGITQPGGGTNPILIEDDTHGDAGGDGSYSFADISTKFPALCIDLGTTPKTYRLTVSLINGDGVGTATTTLQDTNCYVVFDNTRTYSVSTTGRANRWTKLGALVDGTKDSGKNGAGLTFGAATVIQGNAQLYGSLLRTTTGGLTLAPGTTGLTYAVINCIAQSANNSVNLGTTAGSLNTIYNVDVIGGSATLGALANFIADSAERVTIALNTGGVGHIRTGAQFTARDVVFISTPVGGQLRFTSTEAFLVTPMWDQSFKILDSGNSGVVHEMWPYNIQAIDSNSNPIAGLPFTMVNGVGTTVIDTVTDANGMLSYNPVVLDQGGVAHTVVTLTNVVEVVRYSSGGSTTYQGPFTVRLNQGGSAVLGYPARTIVFDWPSTASWDVASVQYQDMFDIIPMGDVGGAPTNWVERVAP